MQLPRWAGLDCDERVEDAMADGLDAAWSRRDNLLPAGVKAPPTLWCALEA